MTLAHTTPTGARRRALGLAAPIAAALALTTACSSAPESRVGPIDPSAAMSAHAPGATALTPQQVEAIARVRRATADFRSLAVAQRAGYTSQYPAGCAASTAGGQGFHYLNPALVDAKVELLRPELVMYEPQRDGSLQLVGVDYVIPFAQWTSTDAPTLLGVPFMRNEPLGVWALHIWTVRDNPSGTFAMWNPRVSCAFAS